MDAVKEDVNLQITEQKPDEPKEKDHRVYSVKILEEIKFAQQHHGLRHGDYQRYRGYCSRRIRRIRKSLKFVQGDRRHFRKRDVSVAVLSDSRYLYIPLMTAERAWSYAMQLKQEANTEPRKKFHVVSRLRKATNYAEKLEKTCEQSTKCDARTKLESQAYAAWMRGTLQFQLQLWEKAMENFQLSQTIYEKLSTVVEEDIQLLYKQRMDEMTPNLRYCAYNIGDQSALQDLLNMRSKGLSEISENLNELIAQTREKQAATLSEVTWRGRTVPVRHEKVRLALLNYQDFDNELTRAEDADARVQTYERLLLECKDAAQVLRDDLQVDPTFKNRTSDISLSTMHYLYVYVMFIRLSKTIERNMIMMDSLKKSMNSDLQPEGQKPAKPQDLIRLLEINLQNIQDIQNLAGVDDDVEMKQEMEQQELAYKALRCFYIAQTLSAARKWPETIALYHRSQEYAQQALKSGLDEKLHSTIEDLLQEVEGSKFSAHAHSVLGSEEVATKFSKLSINSKKPLIERLEEYYEDPSLNTKQPNVAKIPPDFQPIPCKPLFFDLALNHVHFPSLEKQLEQTPQAGGLTGFVKGLWGWGSKK